MFVITKKNYFNPAKEHMPYFGLKVQLFAAVSSISSILSLELTWIMQMLKVNVYIGTSIII